MIEGVTFQPPEFLDTYKKQRKKTGPVDFRETVQLCNAAVEDLVERFDIEPFSDFKPNEQSL